MGTGSSRGIGSKEDQEGLCGMARGNFLTINVLSIKREASEKWIGEGRSHEDY